MILNNTDVIPGAKGSDTLVVLVHGWLRKLRVFSLADVIDTIQCELPDADLMIPQFPSHLAANTDPCEVSAELALVIEEAAARRQRQEGEYREIILIGFSLGSLLVRKAYVYALGETQDLDTSVHRKPRDWPQRVSRIILLAGVNRGWSMSPPPERSPLAYRLLYRFAYPLATWRVAGGLIRSFERGAPFVANLRIQWLRLERLRGPIPPTIQLLGDEDDLVGKEDNLDIQVCSNFVFLEVPNTGHLNALDFHTAPNGERRRDAFLKALLTRPEELKSDLLPLPSSTAATETLAGPSALSIKSWMSDEITDVVFVVHGIRDFGLWTLGVRKRIQSIADQHNRNVFINTSAYQRFPMLGFLLSVSRQENVRWFMDRYTEAFARFPRARFHFIGHSNGTYLLASALQRYAACRFHRVAFAGSVVPRNYPWDRMVRQRRVRSVRNDLASADWVVAVFPRFFELVREVTGISLGDIGSGGFSGFQDNEGNKHQVAFVKGGHGSAIQPANHDSLVRYVLGIDPQPRVDERLERTASASALVGLLATFCWSIWLCLFLLPPLIVGFGLWLWHRLADAQPELLTWLAHHTWFPFAPLLILAAGVVIGIWWLLKTV